MNIFRTIWKNPRAVMREILDNRSFLIPFVILYFGSVGVGLFSLYDSQGMDLSSEIYTDMDMAMEPFEIPIWFSLIIAIVISPIFYFISNIIYSFFTMLFGKWLFKGTGTFKDLLKVNSAAYLPFTVVIPIVGVWLIISPDSFLDARNMGIFGLIVFILVVIFTWIYFFILNLVGVSEAHQFSKWKAFFTMLIPMILFFIFVFLIIAAIFVLLIIIFTSLAAV